MCVWEIWKSVDHDNDVMLYQCLSHLADIDAYTEKFKDDYSSVLVFWQQHLAPETTDADNAWAETETWDVGENAQWSFDFQRHHKI